MSETMRPSFPTRSAGRGWWKAPLISSLVCMALLPLAMVLRGFAEMATDPCNGAGSCPATYAQLHFADGALLAVKVLLALQWPAAYLLPKARVAISLAPAAALVVAVFSMLTLRPGA
ncbi:hypothetical protein F7Q99_00785 [Streptomyces kaniharaensis]|uniref:Uncharacterized protein n=1 Tax=Streptomyces kaniharaensis TaxID=212423 RepID=A0A6N7KHC7_9ACTN|nr:hypothetical protein [Streptomyces kaniharaensis]MQS10850.1 hypothetical protein [Streptomyces kaniharaensis]